MSESPPAPPPGTQTAPLGIPTGFGPSGRAGAPPVQRVRLTFTKEGPLRYIGHLDLVRAWERAFRRARLPLAYTLGFTPHPRLTFAAPLALGATSEGELLDVYLRERLAPEELVRRIREQLPGGWAISRADEVPLAGPSLTALTRWAEYTVQASVAGADDAPATPGQGSRWARQGMPQEAPAAVDESEVPWRPAAERLAPPAPDPPLPPLEALRERARTLLAATELPRERVRDGKPVAYDLRPLTHSVEIEQLDDAAGRATLRLVVRLDASGAGRPDEICAALGLRARLVHRLKIGLEGEPPPAPPTT